MAKSVLDIIINTVKQGGADKETVKGLTAIKTGLAQAGMVAGTFVAAYYAVDKALDATVGTFVEYAAQVRETSRLTGTSAEDTSRLIQMADDLTISYESLQKSMWFASKNGMDVNIDSLAALADQYVALQSPSEKAEFLARKFGKGGAEMGKMLEKAGDGVREMSDAIEDNLILSEEAVAKAREYEIAVDDLSDSFEGVKIAIGSGLIGPMTTLLNNYRDHSAALDIMKEKGLSTYHAMSTAGYPAALALAEAERKAADATATGAGATNSATLSYIAAARAAGDYAGAIEEIDYSDLLDLTLDMQDALDGFAEKTQIINDKIIALDPTTDDYAETLSGLEGELRDNAEAQDLWAKKLVYSMAQARAAVGGTTEGEYAFLIELGVQMGLVDAGVAVMARNLNDKMNSLDFSDAEEEAGDWADVWQGVLDMPDSTTFTVYFESDDSGYMDPTCFVAGTPVTTPGGFVSIEDIQVGDTVSMKTAEGVIEVLVSRKFESERSDLVTVSTSDGQFITCSPNHRWQLADSEWREAEKLKVGDALNTDHGEVWVLGVEKCRGTFTVYNMTTAHADHTYMVGGLVVHNYKIEDSPNPMGLSPMSSRLSGMGDPANTPSVSSGRNTNSGSRTVINVYNPTFHVTSGKGIVDVLEALS